VRGGYDGLPNIRFRVTMASAKRLSEKWFQRGLWLVAIAFAWFLTGLGEAVVSDLPKVERVRTVEDFVDKGQYAALKASAESAKLARKNAQADLDQARLVLQKAQADTRSAREQLNNAIASKRATESAAGDPEIRQRSMGLDNLLAEERAALAKVQVLDKALLDARQQDERAAGAMAEMKRGVQGQIDADRRAQELRVFGYRLALTLPLLALAGWLFARKRHGPYWPFVWGFIFFALVAFFVELVPYLPSYGGYVRYGVGVIVTVLVGRYAIVALNRYLEEQRKVEAKPEAERRKVLAYDVALARLAKGVCPGCERAVDLKDERVDYCPHCGIGLFDRCAKCTGRKSAFAMYCFACGAVARTGDPVSAVADK